MKPVRRTNISYGTIASAMSGMKEGAKVASWKYGGKEKLSTLNAVNMLGWTDNGMDNRLASDIWKGKLKAVYGETGKDYGYYETGGDTITLSRQLLGKGNEAGAELAAVMAHEGTMHMETGWKDLPICRRWRRTGNWRVNSTLRGT